ncbi:hypothetical protein [Streptomyces sp. 4N124]|uniref:hypothetical protein n=1 Tax=Streptomyces sp. 4N124 TaxID=3457420 RepID=UPI003FD0413C
MSDGPTFVEALLKIVGPVGAPEEEYDWNVVESELGAPLPPDYKAIVDRFPRGLFRGLVRVSRPGDPNRPKTDFLGFNRHRLDDLRTARESGRALLPYPVFPEPGGLLPWGFGVQDEHFFWATEDRDPARWPVVVSDSSFTRWSEFGGGIGEFLVEVASGRWDASPFGANLTGEAPFIVEEPPVAPDSAEAEEAAAELSGLFWRLMSTGGPRPEDRFEELSRRIGQPAFTTPRPPVDWTMAEQGLGAAFPSDYKRFIDSYGPGVFADITVCAPGAPGLFDLRRLLERKAREGRGGSDSPFRPPVHPAPEGLICWGETEDGWSCAWAPVGCDPDRWGVVVARPGSHLESVTYTESESFSSFLLRHAEPEGSPGIFVGRDPWLGGAVFRPAVL